MKYKNVPKLLAEEAWIMITDDCKEKMTSLKEPYIKSLTEDIKHFSDKIKDDFAIDFSEWMSDAIHRNYKSGGYWFVKGEIKTTKELLEIYKKEKGL